jgi:hypothetical protein
MISWNGDQLLQKPLPIDPGHALFVGAVVLLSWASYKLLRGLWSLLVIEHKLNDIPMAPGGNFLTGHVMPLLKGTPWNIMAAWVQGNPPLVRNPCIFPKHYAVQLTSVAMQKDNC